MDLRVIKSLIPITEKYGYLTPLSHWNVSVAPSLLASISSFSLTRLILAAGFDTCAKKGGGEKKNELYGV